MPGIRGLSHLLKITWLLYGQAGPGNKVFYFHVQQHKCLLQSALFRGVRKANHVQMTLKSLCTSTCMSSHTPGAQMWGAPDVPVAFLCGGRSDSRGQAWRQTVQLLHADALPFCSRKWLPRASAEDKEAGTARDRQQPGEICMLLETALGCHWYQLFMHSLPLEWEQDTDRLRDGSTQHVRGKQFIFLPQLLTGGAKK